MLLLHGRYSTWGAWALPLLNGLRGTAYPVVLQLQHSVRPMLLLLSSYRIRCTGGCFCVTGAALCEPGRRLWSTVSAGRRTFCLAGAALVHRMLLVRGRCSTRYIGCCFCVAGAAFTEPGRCLWSTVSEEPTSFCVAGAAFGVHRMLSLCGRCST